MKKIVNLIISELKSNLKMEKLIPKTIGKFSWIRWNQLKIWKLKLRKLLAFATSNSISKVLLELKNVNSQADHLRFSQVAQKIAKWIFSTRSRMVHHPKRQIQIQILIYLEAIRIKNGQIYKQISICTKLWWKEIW